MAGCSHQSKKLCNLIRVHDDAVVSICFVCVHVYCRVAQQEASNCMSAQGLAIIFAPSILRTAQQLSPIESLRDVPKQAVLVTFLLSLLIASVVCHPCDSILLASCPEQENFHSRCS